MSTPKIGRQLIRCSFSLLNQHRSWYCFPILCEIIIVSGFAAIAIPFATLEKNLSSANVHITPTAFLITLAAVMVFLFLIHTIFLFFNAALIACVLKLAHHQKATVSTGFSTGFAMLWRLMCWRTFTSFAGSIIMQCEYWKDDWFKTRYATTVMKGFRWYIAFQLAIPVMVGERCGAYAALKRSIDLMRQTWGDAPLCSRLDQGVTWPMVLIRTLSLIPLVIGALTDDTTATIIGSTMTIFLFMTTTVLFSATRMVITTLLYLHATQVDVSSFCAKEILQSTFVRMGLKPSEKQSDHV